MSSHEASADKKRSRPDDEQPTKDDATSTHPAPDGVKRTTIVRLGPSEPLDVALIIYVKAKPVASECITVVYVKMSAYEKAVEERGKHMEDWADDDAVFQFLEANHLDYRTDSHFGVPENIHVKRIVEYACCGTGTTATATVNPKSIEGRIMAQKKRIEAYWTVIRNARDMLKEFKAKEEMMQEAKEENGTESDDDDDDEVS